MSSSWRCALFAVVLGAPLTACALEPGALLDPAANASVADAAPPAAQRGRTADAGLDQAKSYFRDRNFGLAEQAYRSAVEARPDDAEAWLGLAAAYDELGRFELADRAYDRLFKLTGPTAQSLNNRGYSHLMRGEYKRAREDLMAARAKDPKNPRIARNLDLLRR